MSFVGAKMTNSFSLFGWFCIYGIYCKELGLNFLFRVRSLHSFSHSI